MYPWTWPQLLLEELITLKKLRRQGPRSEHVIRQLEIPRLQNTPLQLDPLG